MERLGCTPERNQVAKRRGGRYLLGLPLVGASRMSTTSRVELGSRLRAHREGRGITIAALADSIKTKPSLLDQLERNDLSRWPPGIFGRALVREYAKSIGLPADDVVQQFVQLLSGSEQRSDAPTQSGFESEGTDTAQLRLTLGGTAIPARRSIQIRLLIAAVEAALVLTAAMVVAFLGDFSVWIAIAVIALTWYPARGVLGDYDELYRLLRSYRLSDVLRRTHITHWRSFAARLMLMAKTIVKRRVASGANSLIGDPDVNPQRPRSTSIH